MRNTPVFMIVLLAAVASNASAQRLPSTVLPIHYDITVAPDLAGAKFTGSRPAHAVRRCSGRRWLNGSTGDGWQIDIH
jgi:hypothetical protein